MKNITCVEDLRQAARRRVPRAFFGYAEAGSYFGETLRANRTDMESKSRDRRHAVLGAARSGQITMRKVEGWQSLAEKPSDQIIDLAA